MSTALDHLRSLPRFGTGPGLHRVAWLRRELVAEGGGSTPEHGPGHVPGTWSEIFKSPRNQVPGTWSEGWKTRHERVSGTRAGVLEGIKITGSKGKGSVAAMTAAILRQAGLRVGLYLSPHFRRFEERFQIDGEPVAAEPLSESAGRVWTAVERYRSEHPEDQVSAFEATTALALDLFARNLAPRDSGEEASPAVAVAEAGMGGRFDPVRAFPGPLAALTSLELEHAEVLGRDLETIAFDKADLCPDGGVLVTGEIDPEIRRRLAGALALRGARLVAAPEVLVPRLREVGPRSSVFDLEEGAADGGLQELQGLGPLEGLELPTPVAAQAGNAAVAVLLAGAWLSARDMAGARDRAGEAAEAVRRGLAAVRLPGRFEWLETVPPVVVDVAHTPAALEAVAETVDAALPGRPLVLVAGISRSRDAGMLAPLLERAAAVVPARSRYRGATLAEALAPRRENGAEKQELGQDLEIVRALERARATARELGPGAVILVTGSYFLAAEAAAVVEGREPGELGFEG